MTQANTDTGWATFDDLEACYGAMLDAVTAKAYPRGAYKLTRMGDNQGELGRCVSALARECRHLGWAITDIELYYAPSECVGVVVTAFTRKVQAICQDHGYDDVDAVYEELGQRTSNRWAYDLLGEAMVH